MNIAPFLERQRYRFPAVLVDAVSLHDGVRLQASKAVGVGEEFVQGHFPGLPLMPGVLMLEALTQASSALLLSRPDTPPAARVVLGTKTIQPIHRMRAAALKLNLDVPAHGRRRYLQILDRQARA